jgi:hypothetical protein
MLNVNKFGQIIEIYQVDFSDYERDHIQDSLKQFHVHTKRDENFGVCLNIASLDKTWLNLKGTSCFLHFTV